MRKSIEKLIDTPDRAFQLSVVGRYAFVADGDEGLLVIDLDAGK